MYVSSIRGTKSGRLQLTPIFTHMFNQSLELCEVPLGFRHSNTTSIPGLNSTEYRPVTVGSGVMKSFESLVFRTTCQLMKTTLKIERTTNKKQLKVAEVKVRQHLQGGNSAFSDVHGCKLQAVIN